MSMCKWNYDRMTKVMAEIDKLCIGKKASELNELRDNKQIVETNVGQLSDLIKQTKEEI